MASAGDLHTGLVAERGPAEVEAPGAFGETAEHIEARDTLRALLQRRQRCHQRLQQLFVEQLLALQCALACRQHLVLEGLQLRGDEALGSLEGLAADVLLRGLVGFAAADLDVIAVHPVVTDLERVDAGTLAFASFQVDQELVGVLRQVAQFVQLAVETGGQHAAVAQYHGRVLDDCATEQRLGLWMFADVRSDFLQSRVVEITQAGLQRRQARQAVAQHREITRACRLQRHPGEDALDIADTAEQVLQLLDQAVVEQAGDGRMAFAHRRLVAQRAADPAPQQPAAHRGRGTVEQSGETVLALPGGRLDQFQVTPGRRIDDDAVLMVGDPEPRDVRQGAALGVG